MDLLAHDRPHIFFQPGEGAFKDAGFFQFEKSGNIGQIYLSNTSYSCRDSAATGNQLADVFHVSKQLVRIRTRMLQLIEGEDRSEDKTRRVNPFTVLRSLQNQKCLINALFQCFF